jgi:hypothetical protein
VRINERFAFHVRLEDEWGNATRKARRRVHAGFDTAGITTFAARDAGTGLEADSNPVHVLAPDAAGTLPRWWADLHGQSEETIGSNSIDAYFRYARDCAKIDVLGHQGNDFQVTDTFWDTINRTTRAYNNPGEFVTFPGYEWSGNTPLGGDRNVYFKREGGAIRHSSHDLLPGGTSRYAISPTADDLFDDLAGPEPFVFAHVGGRYADMSMHREGMEAAVEVHSAWGTFEWLVEDALKRGYRVGICANSDGHKGRPGASYPGASRFGSLGGLTCVLAAKLDRAHVHDAIMRRHVYATTGNRPYLDVAVTTADGRSAMMGDVIAAGDGDALLRVRVFGTGAINNVEVRNGLERLKTLRPYRRRDLGPRLRVVWSGAEVKGRARKVAWDGGLSLRGNRIRGVVPVNFWNPMRPLRQLGRNRLRWQSITTGGLAGVILELERPRAGSLAVDTLQKSCCCELGSLGMAPRVYRAGGVHKQIQVSRLPREGKREYAFTCPLPDLRPGDNPIYVRVEQEDGHMAWSSPVYVVR